MLGLENSQILALWGFTIFANFNLLLKKFIDRFCYSFTNFDRLEGRKL